MSRFQGVNPVANDELRELRLSRQIPAKDMVAVVQGIYPKYDKTMQSKCERGGEYGIQLRPDAMEAILVKLAPDWLAAKKRKRGGRHRLTCRISCRLEDGEYALLQQLVKADGFDTMQDWLADTVRRYLLERSIPK